MTTITDWGTGLSDYSSSVESAVESTLRSHQRRLNNTTAIVVPEGYIGSGMVLTFFDLSGNIVTEVPYGTYLYQVDLSTNTNMLMYSVLEQYPNLAAIYASPGPGAGEALYFPIYGYSKIKTEISRGFPLTVGKAYVHWFLLASTVDVPSYTASITAHSITDRIIRG